jgi:superoxide dismutase, Cu-Zn family
MRSSPPVIARLTIAVLVIGLMACARSAVAGMQSGSPVASPEGTPVVTLSIPLHDAKGTDVGVATLSENSNVEVAIIVTVQGLTPGKHGIHIHETGLCDPSGPDAFASAGAHFNPTDGSHGGPDNPEAHAGDLGNIVVDENGEARLEMISTKISLSEGPVTLADADGSALVIHADVDDMMTDPAGNSGDRIVCGVIFRPMGTPEAGTPIAGTPGA